MLRLIKNELKKLSKKKSTYITMLIFVGLLILMNVVTNITIDTNYTDYEFSDENISYLTSEIQTLNPNNSDDIESYIDIKTQLEFINFAKEYEEDSWQRSIALEEAHSIINDIVTQKYRTKNSELLAVAEAKLEDLRTKLNNDDWKSFAKEQKLLYESEINDLNTTIAITTDKSSLDELEKELETKKIMLYSVDYRLDNDLSYEESYLNDALNTYESTRISKLSYNTDNMSSDQKREYDDLLKMESISKYSLDNKIDLQDYTNARNTFVNIIADNLFFFVIFIIMIAGTIVAEEFNKGTIKMLLIRPYQRWKILLSKYITCLIMLSFCIIVIILSQYIIGGVVFGFETYKVPAIVYNFASESLIEMSMIKYLLLNLASILPYLLIILTLAFTISTVFTSTPLAITLSFLTIFFSSIINNLIIINKVKILRFFPTMCWDLSDFLFGGKPVYEYTSLRLCITVDIITLVLMIFISFFVFKRKNVKNI